MLKGILLAALVSLPAASHTIELTYFLKSNHLGDKLNDGRDYNANHNFIGIEYRGFAFASFTNSYYKKSYLLSYAHYWEVADNIETSLRVGAATGYDGEFECMGSGLYAVCPVVAAEVSYTKYDLVVPKLSIMPGVVALSFSARF